MSPKPTSPWGAAVLLASLPVAAEPSPEALSILPRFDARITDDAADRPGGMPSDAALVAAGARVGRILIDPQPIFDTRRADEDSALFRLGNRLHIRTRPETIGNQLLFHSGEVYDPRLLAESARILRNTRYLHEASVVPVA
ncbi:MAG: hypothetical protein QM696_01555 [Steroidobacteraceae bacterium]